MPTIDQSKVPFPSRRQIANYGFRCSLYRPAALAAVNFEAEDAAFEPKPAYVNVASRLEPTPEYARVDPLGITKEDSVLVSDRWWFFSSQEIADGWLIVMTASAVQSHPYIGRAWVSQGNSEVISSSPRRPVYAQWVFAKLSPTDIIPAGIIPAQGEA